MMSPDQTPGKLPRQDFFRLVGAAGAALALEKIFSLNDRSADDDVPQYSEEFRQELLAIMANALVSTADTHFGNQNRDNLAITTALPTFKRLMHVFSQYPPKVIAFGGDMIDGTGDPALDLYYFDQGAEALTVPNSEVAFINGNHDYWHLKYNVRKQVLANKGILLKPYRFISITPRVQLLCIDLDPDGVPGKAPTEALDEAPKELYKDSPTTIVYTHSPTYVSSLRGNYDFRKKERFKDAQMTNGAELRKSLIKTDGPKLIFASNHLHWQSDCEVEGVLYLGLPSFSANFGRIPAGYNPGVFTLFSEEEGVLNIDTFSGDTCIHHKEIAL